MDNAMDIHGMDAHTFCEICAACACRTAELSNIVLASYKAMI